LADRLRPDRGVLQKLFAEMNRVWVLDGLDRDDQPGAIGTLASIM
jgi:hypothetical protein